MKIIIILAVMFTTVSCAKDGYQSQMEAIKHSLAGKHGDEKIMAAFSRCLDVSENRDFLKLMEDKRSEAFKHNSFSELDSYAKSFSPFLKIEIGGEANYVSPDVEFFSEIAEESTVSYLFFSLASHGWYDRRGDLHGGKKIFPDWIVPVSGVEGEDDIKAAKFYLKEWTSLKPRLSGIYLDIAVQTIAKLNEIACQ